LIKPKFLPAELEGTLFTRFKIVCFKISHKMLLLFSLWSVDFSCYIPVFEVLRQECFTYEIKHYFLAHDYIGINRLWRTFYAAFFLFWSCLPVSLVQAQLSTCGQRNFGGFMDNNPDHPSLWIKRIVIPANENGLRELIDILGEYRDFFDYSRSSNHVILFPRESIDFASIETYSVWFSDKGILSSQMKFPVYAFTDGWMLMYRSCLSVRWARLLITSHYEPSPLPVKL